MKWYQNQWYNEWRCTPAVLVQLHSRAKAFVRRRTQTHRQTKQTLNLIVGKGVKSSIIDAAGCVIIAVAPFARVGLMTRRSIQWNTESQVSVAVVGNSHQIKSCGVKARLSLVAFCFYVNLWCWKEKRYVDRVREYQFIHLSRKANSEWFVVVHRGAAFAMVTLGVIHAFASVYDVK